MKRWLVCLGEILVDFLPLERDGTITGFSLHSGGGPFNVAVGLARMGVPTAFVSKVGNDYFGRRLRSHVREEGINDRWLTSVEAPTTLAFVTIEDGEPAFTFYGTAAADTLLTPENITPELVETTALLHFGGISLLRGTTPAAALAAARALHGRALVSLDINVRPRLITDDASYRATVAQAVAACDLLKLSAADIAWLAPDTDPLVYARTQLEAGPCVVALTRGGEGVTALRQQGDSVEQLDVPGFKVQVADTVGAGDTFSAGLLAALADAEVLSRDTLTKMPSANLAEALRRGAAAAALACSRPGANPPTRAELEAFLCT
ncbi:carbohydrate kinase family protein [Candidatus Chloroploca asiatica]|uniref:Carbohydrate kinase PfkB domain-containing protein n=1 Tax=Candidatus Chloroploca asiatica TaxID=1506545 RepID=A0A2H3KKE4_9CHLR|nr:carbohydrate kinase [Candidatus Chloroploca asiatica]PDV97663.1 hypothetical protein A9Q02_04205 [Candidatus Chloroploca asiatica]